MHKNADNQIRYYPSKKKGKSNETVGSGKTLEHTRRGACPRESETRGVFLAKLLNAV